MHRMKSNAKPEVSRIVVEVATLHAIENYLGDQPHKDKRACDLHERVVALLTAAGAS